MRDDDDIEHINMEEEEGEPPEVREPNVASAVDNARERGKLRRILIGITLVAAMLTFVRGIELERFLADFMAVFTITFAAFKFADIEAFAGIYRNYDWIARLFRPWGFILPFILAFMGFWYLLSEAPSRLNILALLVSGTAGTAAFMAVRGKFKNQYAYHKTLLKLPFARISLLENTVMFVLAAALLML